MRLPARMVILALACVRFAGFRADGRILARRHCCLRRVCLLADNLVRQFFCCLVMSESVEHSETDFLERRYECLKWLDDCHYDEDDGCGEGEAPGHEIVFTAQKDG